jgi:hypothetical protein
MKISHAVLFYFACMCVACGAKQQTSSGDAGNDAASVDTANAESGTICTFDNSDFDNCVFAP